MKVMISLDLPCGQHVVLASEPGGRLRIVSVDEAQGVLPKHLAELMGELGRLAGSLDSTHVYSVVVDLPVKEEPKAAPAGTPPDAPG